jgi:hypothetical protein
MKKILVEILMLTIFCLVYFLIPEFRIALLICAGLLSAWILPAQVFLSIGLQDWLDELSDRFGQLSYEDRLAHLRGKFTGLTDAESKKLRWFYVLTLIFHYLLNLAYMLMVAVIVFLLLYYSGGKRDPLFVAESFIAALIIVIIAYLIARKTFSVKQKKVRDEIFNLLTNKDWKKRLFSNTFVNEISDIQSPVSFYSFWLQGKRLEEKEAAFKKFLSDLNQHSNNGALFNIDPSGRVKINPVVYSSALSKSLAGFLKYCIEDRKVLSEAILHHSHRQLIRDVFITDKLKNLVFLEGQRYKDTPVEYINVYRSITID